MKRLAYLFLLPLFLFSCKKVDVPDETPSCVKQKIRRMERDPERYGGLTIERWEQDGVFYYVFPPDRLTSDGMAEMYDEHCNLICYPWGGITGAGSGECPELSHSNVIVMYEIRK
ncbi:MAG: DUF6970 domain-containing protein [Bacteroidia bacterium]